MWANPGAPVTGSRVGVSVTAGVTSLIVSVRPRALVPYGRLGSISPETANGAGCPTGAVSRVGLWRQCLGSDRQGTAAPLTELRDVRSYDISPLSELVT